MPDLALIHTVHGVIPQMEALCRRLLPGVRTAHFLDETVLRDAVQRECVDADIVQRVIRMVVQAERGGASAVLITCSTIGGCADIATPLVSIPVRRIDAPMAAQAVRRGGRMAVAATLKTTLEPTLSLLRMEAERRKRRIRLTEALFAEAFEALAGGDTAAHDRIVCAGLEKLCRRCDTIVLAQASMARVLKLITPPESVRILVSPESGVKQMRSILLLR